MAVTRTLVDYPVVTCWVPGVTRLIAESVPHAIPQSEPFSGLAALGSPVAPGWPLTSDM
jgi:hypothetical protein